MTNRSCSTPADGWTRERILFALAGTMTLLSVLLVATVSPWFLLLTGMVGVNQLLLVVTGLCPASLVVDRLLARAA
jgi:hypothetical protein